MEMNMKTFISGTVSALLLLAIIGAGAQAQPSNAAQPSNVTPGALARFKVEAVSFDAVDETGWFDWTGHDEVYVAIHVPDRQIATYSQIFWGVDSGEGRDIPSDQNCILPIAGVSGPTTLDAGGGRSNPVDRWSCSNDGAPGPISFTVWLYEKDDCPPVFSCFDPGTVPGGTPEPHSEDDLLGSHTVTYSMEELLKLQVGESKVRGSLVTGGGDSSTYDFNWRITRLPDAEPVVSPVTRLQKSSPRE
jgi:hypothetical protein